MTPDIHTIQYLGDGKEVFEPKLTSHLYLDIDQWHLEQLSERLKKRQELDQQFEAI
jgi:hypothetical protein